MQTRRIVPVFQMPPINRVWLEGYFQELKQRTLRPEEFLDALDNEGAVRDQDHSIVLQYLRQCIVVETPINKALDGLGRWINITS